MNNPYKVIVNNKKAYYEFLIEQEIEAGIALKGSEVKSLRLGKVSIVDCHAGEIDGEIFLFNCHIPEYDKANQFNHDTRRPKKLLLHRKEINRLIGKIKQKGFTLVAIKIYFNHKNKVKVLIGLGKGKKLHDKRASIKDKEWKRDQEKALKSKLSE